MAVRCDDTEVELVRLARTGDCDAFGQLIERHRDPVYRLAVRLVGRSVAEDIIQQACLKAWLGLPQFHGEAAFGTWLYRLTANLCLDEFRRSQRTRCVPLDDLELTDGAHDAMAERIVDLLDAQERHRAVAAAIERLPGEDRRLLQLRVGEDLSYDEIGQRLAIEPSTVGTRLFRTRGRLRALLTGARNVTVVLFVLLVAAVASQPEARASIELLLRRVVLREVSNENPPRFLAVRTSSLAEAQRQVKWHILEPGQLPAGYALVGVEADEIHAFAEGPTVVLHYQSRSADHVVELSVTELQASGEVSEPVAAGSARQVTAGSRSALFIDGQWIERDGAAVWQRGQLARLVFEVEQLTIQLQGDPRDGWDADQLARVAASLK